MVLISRTLLFIMHSCHACDKFFSRKDSLLRHQRQYCSAIIPRRQLGNRTEGKQKVGKSNNPIEFSSLDFIQLLTAMFNEQRGRWRKDFKKLKNAILPAENSDSSADEERDSTEDDDDEHKSDTDEARSSSSERTNHTNQRHGHTK